MSSYREMTVTPYTSFWHVNPFHDPREALILLLVLGLLTLRKRYHSLGYNGMTTHIMHINLDLIMDQRYSLTSCQKLQECRNLRGHSYPSLLESVTEQATKDKHFGGEAYQMKV